MHIRIGSRASKLALIQADIVAKKLPYSCTIVPIKTSGDHNTTKPLYDIGGKALFVKELEDALLDNKIDIAVHSLKDVPGILPIDLEIAAILEREDPREVLISKLANSIPSLPYGITLGTSSPRRIAYIKHLRPDINIINLRGNVETRFNKVSSGEIDGTILAYAGIKRLGLENNPICSLIDTSEIIPAIGQGAIAIEIIKTRKEDLQDILSRLNHKTTFDIIKAERAFLEHLHADCKTPTAAYARCDPSHPKNIIVDFMIADEAMTNLRTKRAYCTITTAYDIGKKLANEWAKIS
jgi:hydroxymethylbilane synthase